MVEKKLCRVNGHFKCLFVCLTFFESADARDLGLMTLFFILLQVRVVKIVVVKVVEVKSSSSSSSKSSSGSSSHCNSSRHCSCNREKSRSQSSTF